MGFSKEESLHRAVPAAQQVTTTALAELEQGSSHCMLALQMAVKHYSAWRSFEPVIALAVLLRSLLTLCHPPCRAAQMLPSAASATWPAEYLMPTVRHMQCAWMPDRTVPLDQCSSILLGDHIGGYMGGYWGC